MLRRSSVAPVVPGRCRLTYCTREPGVEIGRSLPRSTSAATVGVGRAGPGVASLRSTNARSTASPRFTSGRPSARRIWFSSCRSNMSGPASASSSDSAGCRVRSRTKRPSASPVNGTLSLPTRRSRRPLEVVTMRPRTSSTATTGETPRTDLELRRAHLDVDAGRGPTDDVEDLLRQRQPTICLPSVTLRWHQFTAIHTLRSSMLGFGRQVSGNLLVGLLSGTSSGACGCHT